ncbi:hypothetical protein J6590_041730 [Homalodisca vitripennis]|nr:hypothetical protein J6590_041730 [Homalodisca vitripennis]
MHGSKMVSLHKHLDPNYLPRDYGGKRPQIDYSSANWYPTLAAIDPHLRERSTLVNSQGETIFQFSQKRGRKARMQEFSETN